MENIGITDQIVRFIIVESAIGLPFLGEDLPRWLVITLIVNAVVLFMTIVLAVCPIYKILGISTKEE